MIWNWEDTSIRDKLLEGIPLKQEEKISFLKTKFHTAREIEHYQHDVLNRMINKKFPRCIALLKPQANRELSRFQRSPLFMVGEKGR